MYRRYKLIHFYRGWRQHARDLARRFDRVVVDWDDLVNENIAVAKYPDMPVAVFLNAVGQQLDNPASRLRKAMEGKCVLVERRDPYYRSDVTIRPLTMGVGACSTWAQVRPETVDFDTATFHCVKEAAEDAGVDNPVTLHK